MSLYRKYMEVAPSRPFPPPPPPHPPKEEWHEAASAELDSRDQCLLIIGLVIWKSLPGQLHQYGKYWCMLSPAAPNWWLAWWRKWVNWSKPVLPTDPRKMSLRQLKGMSSIGLPSGVNYVNDDPWSSHIRSHKGTLFSIGAGRLLPVRGGRQFCSTEQAF